MTDPSLRPRLMVIESDDSVRRVLTRVLGRRFEVTPLATATSGLARAREERFDVVLLDLALTDMTGIELFRTLRSLDADLPVIVTTPMPNADDETQAKALGAIAYIAKPFDTPDLNAPLDVATALAHARRA